jgi:hypothetical protein
VLLTAYEVTSARARAKFENAQEAVKRLLRPPTTNDALNRKQLMQLAIIQGIYRIPEDQKKNQ